MPFPILVSVVMIMQAGGGVSSQPKDERLAGIFGRASKQADLAGVGLVLSSLLADEDKFRSALSESALAGERSTYILFRQDWGPDVKMAWEDRKKWARVRVDLISTKPELVRQAIRVDRYWAYLASRGGIGASTINSFPFTSHSEPNYVDDLIESKLLSLNGEMKQPAEEIKQFKTVLISAEEMEVNLLESWQMLCGICDRLDLIDKVTTKDWRGKFPELDAWFRKNRPYIAWNDRRSCIRIDKKALEGGWPTERRLRAIPELMPPWLPDEP